MNQRILKIRSCSVLLPLPRRHREPAQARGVTPDLHGLGLKAASGPSANVGRDVIERRIQVGADPFRSRHNGDRDKAGKVHIRWRLRRSRRARIGQSTWSRWSPRSAAKTLGPPAYFEVNADTASASTRTQSPPPYGRAAAFDIPVGYRVLARWPGISGQVATPVGNGHRPSVSGGD